MAESTTHQPSPAPPTFKEWCDKLREVSKAHPEFLGPDAIATTGTECWRGYFEDGYSPEEAFHEDASYD